MNNNKLALASLAMDLKRMALGYYRGSPNTAKRFFKEALKRRDEVDQNAVKPYLRKLLVGLNTITREKDRQKIAEDALMYSTLFQNAALAK
ncbi:MAG: hypothetical protein HYY87_02105 [Candidatus Levybacteria bacterium]|nr:hypothetical protein [Candidatus Levybacteria bacterium]MBI2622560.1 hypothetical protein [Candidatus Levybacteria bacterium]MBI3070074.1 hypothetical protein [Candidatus Levybacteria bacterium]